MLQIQIQKMITLKQVSQLDIVCHKEVLSLLHNSVLQNILARLTKYFLHDHPEH